jgi:hypothetical protein
MYLLVKYGLAKSIPPIFPPLTPGMTVFSSSRLTHGLNLEGRKMEVEQFYEAMRTLTPATQAKVHALIASQAAPAGRHDQWLVECQAKLTT